MDETGSQHEIIQYPMSLPLRLADFIKEGHNMTESSCRLEPTGWAWLVCSGRLFVWRFASDSLRVDRPLNGRLQFCRELLFDGAFLGSSADLVAVVRPSSLVVCSTDGRLNYYPSLSSQTFSSMKLALSENALVGFVRTTADCVAAGQTSWSSSQSSSVLCYLFTSDLCVLKLSLDGRGKLKADSLMALQSAVAGPSAPSPGDGAIAHVSRRISSLFGWTAAGANQSQVSMDTEQPLSRLELDENGCLRCDFVVDVGELLRDALRCHVFDDIIHDDDLDVFPIGLQLHESSVVLALAARNRPVDGNRLVFYVARFSLASSDQEADGQEDGDGGPLRLVSCCPIRYHLTLEQADGSIDDLAAPFHFLIPTMESSSMFLYDWKTLIAVASNAPDQLIDVADFDRGGDALLGAGTDEVGRAVFFSVLQQIVYVQRTELAAERLMTDGEDGTALQDSGPVQIPQVQKSIDSLREAVRAHFHKNHARASQLMQRCVEELRACPADSYRVTSGGHLSLGADHQLDLMLCDYALWICDRTMPHGMTTPAVGGGDESADRVWVMVRNQLSQKLQALNAFIKLLQSTDVWESLRAVSWQLFGSGGVVVNVDSRLFIRDLRGLITLARTSAEFLIARSSLYDTVFAVVSEHWPEPVSASSPFPFLYQVSKITALLPIVVNDELRIVHGDTDPLSTLDIVTDYGQFVRGAVEAINNYLVSSEVVNQGLTLASVATHASLMWFSVREPAAASSELGSSQVKTLRGAIAAQNALSRSRIQLAASVCRQKYDELVHQVTVLTDALLFCCNIESHALTDESVTGGDRLTDTAVALKRIDDERRALFDGLDVLNEPEHALVLAEKHSDFATLVRICDMRRDFRRLRQYCAKFETSTVLSDHPLLRGKTFVEFIMHWYAMARRTEFLLEIKQTVFDSNSRKAALAKFLSSAKNQRVLWAYHVQENEYEAAANVLLKLAVEEKSIDAKKTWLSLAKLNLLASLPDQHNLDASILAVQQPAIFSRLQTIEQHNRLVALQHLIPDSVLSAFGFCGEDADFVPVLSRDQLLDALTRPPTVEVANLVRFRRVDFFLAAMDVLQIMIEELNANPNDLEKKKKLNEAKTTVAVRLILCDDWPALAVDPNKLTFLNPAEFFADTTLYRVLVQIRTAGADVAAFLPDVVALVERSQELAAMAADNQWVRTSILGCIENASVDQ